MIEKQLKKIGIYEAMVGKKHPARAYQNAVESLYLTSEKEFNHLLIKSRVDQLPGIGPVIAKKIYELRDTGIINKLISYEQHYPININELIKIDGLGPRTIYRLFTQLGIKIKFGLD